MSWRWPNRKAAARSHPDGIQLPIMDGYTHNDQIRTLDPAVCAERKVALIYCRFVIARSDCDEAIQLLRLATWIASLRSQ